MTILPWARGIRQPDAACRSSRRRRWTHVRSGGAVPQRPTLGPWVTSSARSTRERRARGSSSSTTTGARSRATSSSTSRCCRRAGWVEHNPLEIWDRTRTVIGSALTTAGLATSDLAAIGVTNQRETAIVWDRRTGRPFHHAIVWQDTRTDSIAKALDADGRGDVIRHKAGLPPATYFSAGKVQWMLEHVDGLRDAAERGDALFGTPDSWVVWNLTGGPDGGIHATDVTNASRTMLMDLTTLDWDDELLGFFGIPRAMLPTIHPSSDPTAYGTTTGGRGSAPVPITGVLGDQQAATVGQVCFEPGEAKNTYGTGNFLLLNTGRGARPEHERPAHDGRLPARRREAGLRPRGLDRRDGERGAVAARPAGHHLGRLRGRGARRVGRGHRRRLLRAGVQRPVRPLLAQRRPRRHRRPLALQHQRPPRPRHARGDLLPVARRRRRDGGRLRCRR